MDDMKRLIEKYKQELMDYSRASSKPTPQPLEFPEMIAEENAIISDGLADDMLTDEPAYTEGINSFYEPVQEFIYEPEPLADVDTEPDSDIVAEDEIQSYGFVGVAPESGNSYDEQLANRPFEPEQPTVNSPEDVQPLTQEGTDLPPVTEPDYSSFEEYIAANPRKGTLKFTVNTARGALPVKEATVVVYKNIGGSDRAFHNFVTDESGQTPVMQLPAPSSGLSQVPDSAVLPFSQYDAYISAEGYNDVLIRDIPVFEGIDSLQQVAMVPSVGMVRGDISDLREVNDARK